MVRISISELNPAGADLFSDSENFMDSVTDLSAAELKLTGGTYCYGGSKKNKSKNKSKKGSKGYYCYPCY
jgi:hypothetical protein